MSDHVTQETIYGYLDRELGEPELGAAQAHLAECAECRRRLALAEQLFEQIGRLPDEPIAVDLVPGVLERLQPATGWLPRLAVGQLLAALALGLALLIGLGGGAVSSRLIAAGRQTSQGLDAALRVAVPAIAAWLPDPGSLRIELGVSAIWTVAGGSLALWALGNGLVLRRLSGRNRA